MNPLHLQSSGDYKSKVNFFLNYCQNQNNYFILFRVLTSRIFFNEEFNLRKKQKM